MAEHTSHSQPSGHGAGHADEYGHDAQHGGNGKYIAVFIALCLLTACSFITYTDVWRNNFNKHVGWALMMAVSCTKAMLVILFFMHLIWEASWKWVLTIPAAMMSIFLILMLVPDVGERTKYYNYDRRIHAPEEIHTIDEIPIEGAGAKPAESKGHH